VYVGAGPDDLSLDVYRLSGPLDRTRRARDRRRYYSQDDQATFQIANPDAFPMQPEDSSNTSMIFDVPSKVAASALSQGELVFPGEKDSTIDYASKIDAIRLGHAAGGGQSQPAPDASPTPETSPVPSDSPALPA
jgi:hypothetical protein